MQLQRAPFRALVRHPELFWLTVTFVPNCLAAFNNLPRWAQASALVNDKLFVHGGKTDQFNSYSYTSAPTNNDLLLLNLSSGFDPSSPPWQYISGSEVPSTSQGPQLAWHSLSAFNESQLLLFGGDGGPNSPIVLPAQADSASLLDVLNLAGPRWISEAPSWANEPIRRIHHSTSSSGGKIYIIGGEKDDGSNTGLSDHYVFDSNMPSFTQLPTENGPPDIYGHASIMLSDGRLLVLGGYCQSQASLLPFSTIWSINITESSPQWSEVAVANDTLPAPRRAFASVWLSDDRVLIHGGADSALQTSLADGWILDTTKNPMAWTNVTALFDIGARRDHFAVQSGSLVLLGFGYESNGPASISLSVFDLSKNALISTYSPPSTQSIHMTLPFPSGTGGSGGPSPTGVTPSGSGPPNGRDPNPAGSSSSGKNMSAIALGAIFGFVGLVAVVSTTYVLRTRRSRSHQFRLLDDKLDSPAVAQLGMLGFSWLNKRNGRRMRISGENIGGTFLGINIARRGQETAQGRRRVDMLADEDSREFENLQTIRERTGSSASWYSIRNVHERSYSAPDARPGFGSWLGGSVASLRSLGALLAGSGGIRRVPTNEMHSLPDDEKDWMPLNPFSDENALAYADHASAEELQPSRLRAGHLEDNAASPDPFNNSNPVSSFGYAIGPIVTNVRMLGDSILHDLPSLDGSSLSSLTISSALPSLPPLAIVSSENSSAAEHSVCSGAISNQGKDREGTRHAGTSHVSQIRSSSIIDASTTVFQPVKRSDSWWSKLKRGNQREELAKSPTKTELEFRDPNPAPKLSAIHEASLSTSEPSESAEKGRDALGLYLTAGMGRSLTSLKTSKTADSETIERFAGSVAVVQRETTEASGEYASSGIRTPEASGSWSYSSEPRRLLNSSDGSIWDANEHHLVQSPVEGTGELPSIPENSSNPGKSSTKQVSEYDEWKTKSLRKLSQGGAVASRVASYERRMTSENRTEPQSPVKSTETSDRRRRAQSVKYGLMHRPELFIANPDSRKVQASGDS